MGKRSGPPKDRNARRSDWLMRGYPDWLLRILAHGVLGNAAISEDFWGTIIANAAIANLNRHSKYY